MDAQDKALIELYLKDSRRKKIILSIICIFFLGFIFFVFYKYPIKSKEEGKIEQELGNDLIQNESIENLVEESSLNEISQDVEVKEEIIDNIEIEQEQKNEITKEENKKVESSAKEKNIENVKPVNKDFLFVDGYTMDNVTQIAQEYLLKSGHAGKCIPLSDEEGIYIGMRVTFD